MLNWGVDLLNRGDPLYAEWRFHPDVPNLVSEQYGRPFADLFATWEITQCPLFFSLRNQDAPLGVDALALCALLYAFLQ